MSFKLSQFNERTQAKLRALLDDDLRRVEASQPKQATPQALDGDDAKYQSSKSGMGCVVSFVALLRKSFDDDNLIASIKPLRDAIAASIGIDDGDKRIKFQYQQLQTKGREGVLVHIEVI